MTPTNPMANQIAIFIKNDLLQLSIPEFLAAAFWNALRSL